MLNMNCKKVSLNNFICHLLFLKHLSPYSYTSLCIHSWVFKTLQVIISWVWVICKRLNMNCIKIQSIILSVTCHGLRNLTPTHTHPLVSICEFSKPYKLLFLEFESFIKIWMWIGKKSLNNFICHLLFLKELPPKHTHPPISIHEFSKPYNLLFTEFESFINGWMWIGKKLTQ